MSTVNFKKNRYSNDGFEMFSFVASARMGEKEKNGLKQIFYDGKKKRIWATDGHRLHLANIDMGEEDRCFNVILQKKSEITLDDIKKEDFPNRPNITAVLSDIRPIARHDVSISPEHPEIAYTKLMRLFQKVVVNFKFFTSLLTFAVSWMAIIQDDETGPLVFKSDKCLAVIMPMNIGN